jgi:MFS family permease
VERFGRLLTVVGVAAVMIGLTVTAVVLWRAPGSAGWAIAAPLLLAGLGGGLVIPPNLTMTLRCVPVAMAGSAGGALQTVQRIGAAVGTAALAGLYYAVLSATGGDQPVAVAVALGGAVGAIGIALLIGLVEWRRSRPDRRARPDPEEHPVVPSMDG